MEPRLSLLTLGVDDVARSRAFYERLRFTASGPENDDVAFFMAGGIVLSLYTRARLIEDTGLTDGPRTFPGITLAHNVRTEGEVVRVLDEAVAAGGRQVKAAHRAHWGGTIGFFADPDGHVWEVAYNADFPIDTAGNLQLPSAKP